MREPRRKSCGPQNVRPSTNPDASQQLHDPNVNGSTCIMVICLVRSMYLVLNVEMHECESLKMPNEKL